MTNRSKAKGTSAETAVAGFLRDNGFPHVERRALNGNVDKGDLSGIPGVVVEIKNCAKTELAAWVDEAKVERGNDRADYGVVIHKRRGKGNPGDWYATLTVRELANLLRQAGYGTPKESE